MTGALPGDGEMTGVTDDPVAAFSDELAADDHLIFDDWPSGVRRQGAIHDATARRDAS